MTFSLLAWDGDAAQIGVATATHAYGVGPVADHVRPGVGVVATQSFVEVSYGPRGLDLLEDGVAAGVALARLVAEDPDQDIRQVGFIDASGTVAHHTGARCVQFCGAAESGSVLALGNMLASDRVLDSMLGAFLAAEGDLADRLLAGLDAGDRAGGDVRGRMSAALQVVSTDRPALPWHGEVVDLRVDFDPDPFARLHESLRVHRAYGVFFESVFAPGLVTGSSPVVDAELEAALDGLAATQDALGDDLEPTVWRGVLLLRAGRLDEGAAALNLAIERRPEFAVFVDNLIAAGTIPERAAEAARWGRS